METSKFIPGPWFIWQEKAMQEEGMEEDEIQAEMEENEDFSIMAGTPVGPVSRGRIVGCKSVVSLDSYDFDDTDGEGQKIALATARLIAAAPTLLEQAKHNKKCRDAVLALLLEAGYDDDSSACNILECMNFDGIGLVEK
jgi:hypothetical protein